MSDRVMEITRELILDEGHSTGLIKRNYSTHPSGYLAHAPTFSEADLFPENEWKSRLRDQQQANASLYDVRELFYDILKSLDQDGLGLCWAFSTTKSVMYDIAAMGRQAVILSAWYLAGRIVKWQDQGYWGAASTAGAVDFGIPEMALCPAYRASYDTADVRANAARNKITEWWDGTEDRAMNRKIMHTSFLMGKAPVLDYNHIGHSMCGCRLVDIDEVDCDNSWGPDYGTKGLYHLSGDKATPDGIVVPRVVMAG